MNNINIINFCIIAHIDHGKSTIADRLLEYTGTVSSRKMKDQILDDMDLEKERGITIKSKTVRMNYIDINNNKKYIFNLIDTPGHVDFSYEVSRALIARDGAKLVIDSTQGVEDQTIANEKLAKDAKLKIIPVINKIDLPTSDIDGVSKQIKNMFNLNIEPVCISAKNGIGIDKLIKSIITNIPKADIKIDKPLSALIFDSFYDSYRGVIVIVKIFDGTIYEGMNIKFITRNVEYSVSEVGYMQMKLVPSNKLISGEVGYIVANIKNIDDVKIGDTITECSNLTKNIHKGYKKIKPFVFAGLYLNNSSEYNLLKIALSKLRLTDSSFVYFQETSFALGYGFRCGFLGSLHLEIIKERLKREFGLNVFVTIPNVVYEIRKNDNIIVVDNPTKFPNNVSSYKIFEPYVEASIICPADYLGSIFELCKKRRGEQVVMKYIDEKIVILIYNIPLSEIIIGFYDLLKSVSKGYASFDYKHISYKIADLLKLEIIINHEIVDAFTSIVHKDKANNIAHFFINKLKSIIPKHMFEIPIQAKINNKIIARETISAIRKDVLAKCYGGDITRKRKLLEKQKEGKRKMKQFGKINIPVDAFVDVIKIDEY
jgi:GTP-binding protein LepA